MTLNLGQEIPVLSTVFGAPVPGGFATIPQSSFNYRTVGVNIEITPRVTYEGEIILELTVENSSLGAADRRRRPVRAVVHVAQGARRSCGCAKGKRTCSRACSARNDRKALQRVPGLMQVPVIKQLFGDNDNRANRPTS